MEKTSCSFYPDCTIETNATLEADRVMYGLDVSLLACIKPHLVFRV